MKAIITILMGIVLIMGFTALGVYVGVMLFGTSVLMVVPSMVGGTLGYYTAALVTEA